MNRKRKDNESYDDYKKNLKKESFIQKMKKRLD